MGPAITHNRDSGSESGSRLTGWQSRRACRRHFRITSSTGTCGGGQRAFYALGHGGQLIYVVPEENVVVVIRADSYSNSRALDSNFDELFLDIMNAIID